MIPFHMAFAIDDKEAARHIYGTAIRCKDGREAENWIDFDFFGHQIRSLIGSFQPCEKQIEIAHELL